MKNRARLLTALLAALMCFVLFISAGAADAVPPPDVKDAEGSLVFIHVNDVHSRVDDKIGYAGLKARIDEYENAGAEVVVLDAGDTFHGKPISVANKGESIADILNSVGVDAMAPGNRTKTTNLGELTANAIRHVARAAGYDPDFCLINGGSVRASIPAGDITKGDLVEVFPFGNQIVVFDLPGSVILEALEANTSETPAPEGGFPQTADIFFSVILVVRQG